LNKDRIDYFEYYTPFEKGILWGRITRLEDAPNGDTLFIDLSLKNRKLIEHNALFFSNDGFLTSLISYRDERSETNRNRLREHYNARTEDINFFVRNNQLTIDIFENPQLALEQIRINLRPYLFCLEGNVVASAEIRNFLEDCYERQNYFQLKLIFGEEDDLGINPNELQDDFIYGDLFFSASTPKEVHAKLKIICEQKDITDDGLELSYSNIVDNENLHNLSDRVDNLFPNAIKEINFICFNVGSGLNTNINIISAESEMTRVKFDIGASMSHKKDKSFKYDKDNFYQNPSSEFLHIPEMTVLSHWDLDHIKGIEFYDTYEIYKMLWIAPNINNLKACDISDFAKMLCVCICLNERIDRRIGLYMYLVDKCLNNTIIHSNTYMTIAKTKGINDMTSSKRKNNYGLALKLHNSKSLLLTGDSDYDNLPDCVNGQHYDVFIMPHHGSDNQNPYFLPQTRFPVKPRTCCALEISASCLYGCICCKKYLNRETCKVRDISVEDFGKNRKEIMNNFIMNRILHKYSISIIPVGTNTHKHPKIKEIEKMQQLGFLTWCTCCNGIFNIVL